MTTQIQPAGEMTEAESISIHDAIMSLPGMKKLYTSHAQLANSNNGLYIKFMSDYGLTDDHNGTVLRNFLLANEVPVESYRLRSMTANLEDFRKAFAKLARNTPVSAKSVMMSAHALVPTELSHPDKMEWMANYFLANYKAPL